MLGQPMRLILFGILLFLVREGVNAQVPLLGCLPGGRAPARIESALGPSLAPRKVIAFVRVRDLEDVLPSYPKASIVTTSAYAVYLNGYTIQLKARKKEPQTKSLIVSADST